MIIVYHSICLTLSLKSCKKDAFRTSFGNEFHSLGAEYEKDLSNIDVLDLGTANVHWSMILVLDYVFRMQVLTGCNIFWCNFIC